MACLESFTITGTNEVVRVGDSVLMRCSENENDRYMALVLSIKADDVNGEVKVEVKRYYHQEETIGGRREFHGMKELILTNHFETQSAHTIVRKCIVRTFVNYTTLGGISEPEMPRIPKEEKRDSTLLKQIRAKSVNLKPVVQTRPKIRNPRVDAIFEKAYAIRVAFAGIDDDEDEGDSWSD